MRGLSLTAPYGTLISIAERWPELGKHHETRSWATRYRGWLAIHQSKGLGPVGGSSGLTELCAQQPFAHALRTWRLWQLGEYKDLPFEREADRLRRQMEYTAEPAEALPRGCIVAVAWIEECYQVGRKGSLFAHGTTRPLPRGNDLAFGDYTPGRFAWKLTQIRALPEPVPCRGMQGLWTVPTDVEAVVWAQLGQVAA